MALFSSVCMQCVFMWLPCLLWLWIPSMCWGLFDDCLWLDLPPELQTYVPIAYSTAPLLTCPISISSLKGLEKSSSLAWYEFLPASYFPVSVNGFTVNPYAPARACTTPIPVFFILHIQNSSASFHFISKTYFGSDYSWELPLLQAEAQHPSSFAWFTTTSSIPVSLHPN